MEVASLVKVPIGKAGGTAAPKAPCMKPESLVIAGHPYGSEFVPGPNTHCPSRYASWPFPTRRRMLKARHPPGAQNDEGYVLHGENDLNMTFPRCIKLCAGRLQLGESIGPRSDRPEPDQGLRKIVKWTEDRIKKFAVET